uniref:CYP76AA72 n=1 Tax=Taxus chinensis TaxID=29808 RepID=A0A291FAV7_TAXCH|nr:CYP76AA72 [Taxus chinensis]
MDISPILPTAVLILIVFYFLWRSKHSRATVLLRLPPGPHAWPIVGNLFQLGKKPHESLHALSLQYGPLMMLRLGMKTTVVASSPAMAKEILKTHDLALAGRSVIETAKALSFHKTSIIWGECGAQWRHLRRIAASELFNPRRLADLQPLRRDQVFRTIRLIFEERGKAVDIGHMAFNTSVNLLGNMIFSSSLFDTHNPATVRFIDAVWKMMKLGGKPNWVDYFPFLRFLDPQGLCRETAKHMKGMYDFADSCIHDRLAARSKNQGSNDSEKDYLDILLDFISEDFTLVGVRGYIAELFIAGTETTTTTIEWVMAEFIRNPQKMKMVRRELDEIVGGNRRVEESDLDSLHYLHAAVKEIFRLHPTAPLLMPHKAESACKIGEFVIPKGSEVMVNVWAMGRDPAIWKEPLEFIPERFLEDENSKLEYKGQNYQLIPFGSGRRMCVGLPLASRMVHLVVASLLHSFEWTLPDGMRCEEMDMSEEFRITLKKSKELNAIPIPRLPHHIY